jgi:biotin carboxylase
MPGRPSLRPNQTRGLKSPQKTHLERSFSMRIALRTLLGVTLLTVASSSAQDKETKVEVKPLTVKNLPITVGGGSAVTVIKSTQELQKVAGKKAAEELASQVDFQKQDIVFVSWTTAGPPFGKLEFEVIGKGKELAVEFYIREPKVNARGQAARIGADFFAVPKETKARMGKSR